MNAVSSSISAAKSAMVGLRLQINGLRVNPIYIYIHIYI